MLQRNDYLFVSTGTGYYEKCMNRKYAYVWIKEMVSSNNVKNIFQKFEFHRTQMTLFEKDWCNQWSWKKNRKSGIVLFIMFYHYVRPLWSILCMCVCVLLLFQFSLYWKSKFGLNSTGHFMEFSFFFIIVIGKPIHLFLVSSQKNSSGLLISRTVGLTMFKFIYLDIFAYYFRNVYA